MTDYEVLKPLFENWKSRIETLKKEHPLQIISWEATRRCNLMCSHCGSPSEEVDIASELTKYEIIEAFNEIAQDFDMNHFRHINITGGEPFVRNDLLTILQTINRWPYYRNIDIQTNGVFISENPFILKELKNLGVTGLGISIDGFESSHDTLRGIPGTWVKAVNAAQLTVAAGYVVTVSFVAHSGNINELESFFKFVKDEIKPRVFRVMFIDLMGRVQENSDHLLKPNQLLRVIDFLKKEYDNSCSTYSNPSSTMVELGCGGWLGTELEGRVRPFIFHCIAGLNNLGILFDGKLASCSNISRDFIQGDLRTDNIHEVWENRYQIFRDASWRKTGDCVQCSEWAYCDGGPMHKRFINGQKTSCIFVDLSDFDVTQYIEEWR